MASLTKDYSVKINTGLSQSQHHNVRRGLGLLLAIALIGCSSNLPSDAPANSSKGPSLQQLLDAAHSSSIEQRAPYLRDAAALALQQNDIPQTERILQELDALKLTAKERTQSKVLRAQLQMKQHQPGPALAALQDRQLLQEVAQLAPREQIDISLLRAQALFETRNYLGSVQEWVFIDPLLNDNERQQNHKKIWRALMSLSPTDVERYRNKADNQSLRGWLELAAIALRNSSSATRQAQLADWLRQWASHVAAQDLPNDLAQLRSNRATSSASAPNAAASNQTTQPKQIALLLPLSGKLAAFGMAVRDGFLAAWYDNQKRGGNPPPVRVYDSDSGTDIVQLYQQTVSDGAALVIGPLEKQQVAQLYQQNLPVPTLALNRFESNNPAAVNLYQFSLAAEDETAQIADIASQENHRSALIIAPEDELNSRELQAFQQRWRERGGNVGAIAGYRDQQNMSQAIRGALNIPRSEARAKELEGILNRNIEFTPHRRQDIDMVFILAKPAQARVIKPLLDFYYAGDLTVYATSRIYSGYPIPNLDRDIDKVRFTEMPFVVQGSELKQQILSAQPQSKNYLRLYAMGIDSFNLSPLLLTNNPVDSTLAGQTGQLTIDAEKVLRRESLLAIMRSGSLQSVAIAPAPIVDTPLSAPALRPESRREQQPEPRQESPSDTLPSIIEEPEADAAANDE
jgi:uncharacterized protein